MIQSLCLSLFFLLVLSAPAPAAILDKETIRICNQVMADIYQDILAHKNSYPELADFGENAFYENKDGIYAIVYEPKPKSADRNSLGYSFGLTIDGVSETTFPPKAGSFNFSFPMLGLKFSGYQPYALRKGQFDLRVVVSRHGMPLSLHEQKYLPLRLVLKPTKESFRVNEPVEFDIGLVNVGNTNVYVKKLDFQTLYLLIDGKPWGTPPSNKLTGGERVALQPKQYIWTHFKRESYAQPAEIEIQGFYRMAVNGVNPFAAIKIKIRE